MADIFEKTVCQLPRRWNILPWTTIRPHSMSWFAIGALFIVLIVVVCRESVPPRATRLWAALGSIPWDSYWYQLLLSSSKRWNSWWPGMGENIKRYCDCLFWNRVVKSSESLTVLCCCSLFHLARGLWIVFESGSFHPALYRAHMSGVRQPSEILWTENVPCLLPAGTHQWSLELGARSSELGARSSAAITDLP